MHTFEVHSLLYQFYDVNLKTVKLGLGIHLVMFYKEELEPQRFFTPSSSYKPKSTLLIVQRLQYDRDDRPL